MATITQKITIDVARANVFSAIIGKQFDTDSRFLNCTLAQEGVAMEIESGVTVSINARRPDNTTSSFAGERNADGTVTVPIDEWILEQNGMVSLSVSIVSASGEKLTSCTFYLNVQQAEGEGWLWVYTATGVVATGTYHINFGGTDYEFTLPTALESGDKIYFSSALDYAKSVEPTGAEIDTMILTVGSGGTALVSSELINFLASLESELASYNSRVESVEDALDTKADKSGEFEDLTAGTAQAVIDKNSYSSNTTPYLHRISPSGKRCEYDVIGGSVAWNQLIDNGNFESNTGWFSSETLTVNNNIATITYNESGRPRVARSITSYTQLAHKYVFHCEAKNTYDISIKVGFASSNSGGSASLPFAISNTWTECVGIYNRANNATPLNYVFAGIPLQDTALSQSGTLEIRNIYFVDLTTLLGSTIADYAYQLEQNASGSGIAWLKSFGFLTKSYYPYCEPTLESVQATERKAVGINLFDKATMVVDGKYISNITGAEVSGSVASCTDFIEIFSNTAYYIKTDATIGRWGAWYDADKNFISGITGIGVQTAPVNARYIRYTVIAGSSSGGSSDTFCINLSNPTINGQYFPYESHTYPLSEITLRGIPKLDSSNNIYYDGDVYKASGEITRKYGVVDLGSLNWEYMTTYFRANLPTPAVPNALNIRTTAYSNVVIGSQVSSANGNIGINGSGGMVYIRDDFYTSASAFKTAMSGVYLVYELATPTTESADSFTPIQFTGSTEEFSTDNDVPVGVDAKYYTDLTLPKLPTANGTYTLKCTVTDGTGIVSWVSE